ncbi:hypothetical protein [Fictibacillus terranigra]|uniref:Uncharacterized protein n=1 Tax=Fictibacillus terranigra TaxID=3058424 RepID=A0ABT8E8M7_9BACL|nr:hypothetical protein [Fictibacillus sp. CENA-BCM004]MDN4074242.1 hypothetical protein [Fictibacillus sp. CENA-BCM004]
MERSDDMKSLPFFYMLFLINGLLLAGGLVSPTYVVVARWSMVFFNITALAALVYFKEQSKRKRWSNVSPRGRVLWWGAFLFNIVSAANEVLHSGLFQ